MKIPLTNKKIGLIIILAVFFLLAIAGSGWAITVWNEGYRVNRSGGTADAIVAGPTGACQKVTNNNTTNDYFIPTRTQAEWDAFNANKPSGITTENCYTYAYTAWVYGACNVACGGGTQSLTRSCQRSDAVIVDCSFCGGVCSSSQACNTQVCSAIWTIVQTSGCSPAQCSPEYNSIPGTSCSPVGLMDCRPLAYCGSIYFNNYLLRCQ